MVRWIASLLLFGGLLANSELLVAQVEDDRAKILLEKIIKDDPRAERLRAEQELEGLGEDVVFDLMLITLENPDDEVRAQAMEALEGIVSRHPEWRIPRLVVARIDYSTDRRYVTAQFGEDAEEFLSTSAEDSLPRVRRNALYLLSFLELPGDKVLPIYRKGLEDADRTVRIAAAVGLIRSGERTPKAIETLVQCVGTDNLNYLIKETIRENELYFHEPLVRRVIDPESSDEVYLDSIDLLDRYGVTDVLSAAFNPLREALRSKDRTVQVRAAMALAVLRYDTPSVADVLAGEIVTAGPKLDEVLDAVEESHLNSRRLNEAILELTRSEDLDLANRGFLLARDRRLNGRHAEELAEHLLSESHFLMAVEALGWFEQVVPFKPEYVAPLKRLVYQGSEDSAKAINLLLNMGDPGLEVALDLFDEPDLPSSMRIDLIQKVVLHVRYPAGDDRLTVALDRVAKNLNHENPWVTTRTAIALLKAGYDQDPLIPILLKEYASQNSSLSKACHISLFYHGQEDDAAVAFLLDKLEDANPEQREEILVLLNKMGSNSPQAVNLVAEYLLSDIKDNTRERFAYDINEPVAERLSTFFEQGTAENRRRAMVAVRDALEYSKGFDRPVWKEVEGEEPPAGVIAALSAEEDGLRFAAAMLLLSYQPQAEEAMPVLREMLRSDDRRREALTALQQFGPAATPLMPDLLALLRNDELEPNEKDAVRSRVLSVLQPMGPKAAIAVPDLIELLRDPEIREHHNEWMGFGGIPDVLASIGEAAKPAEPFLIEMLPEVERLTPLAKALKSMGGSTQELIAEMDRRLNDPILCYQAVGELPVICDIEPVTPRLIKILESDNLALKRDVAELLSWRELVRDPMLVPLLKELLLEESPEVREKAIGALAVHAVPVGILIERLQNDERVEVRSTVVESLEAYADGLLQSYRHYASNMSKAAIDRSVQRGDESGLSIMAAIPVLEEVLREPHGQENSAGYLKIHAAYTLARFGETAKRSLPLLLELHGQSRGGAERLEFRRWGVERWENALLTAIWSIDLETAIENELPRPRPRRDW